MEGNALIAGGDTMRMRRKLLVGVLGVAVWSGCGDSGGGGIDLEIPYPNMIVYREAGGTWNTPKVADSSNGQYRYHLDVHDKFEIVLVRGVDNGAAYSEELLATLDEWPTIASRWPNRAELITPTVVDVSGRVQQPGSVFLDWSRADSTSAPWGYQMSCRTGARDLVAVANDRVVVRRAQNIASGFQEPDIDVTMEGFSLQQVGLSIGGIASGDTLSTALVLRTAGGTAALLSQRSDSAEMLAPASMLEAGDRQELELVVSSQSPNTYRDVIAHAVTASTTAFTLPDRITGAAFGTDTSASWSAPAGDFSLVQLSSSAAPSPQTAPSAQIVTATSGSLAGDTSLSWDANIPGYDPAWSPPASAARGLTIVT